MLLLLNVAYVFFAQVATLFLAERILGTEYQIPTIKYTR